MILRLAVMLALTCRLESALAGLVLVSDGATSVFPKVQRSLSVTLRNEADVVFTNELRTEVIQESSATVMRVGPVKRWKRLHVEPKQTVVEVVKAEFPEVEAETRFQIRVIDENTNVICRIPVRVYPRTLLDALKVLGRKASVGVLDPTGEVTSVLKSSGVELYNLDSGSGFDGFEGSLAIIGPFTADHGPPENLRRRILEQARKKSMSFIVIAPTASDSDDFPPIYSLREATSPIVVVHPKAVANLADSPQAQQRLIKAVEMATQPNTFQMPRLTTE